MLGNRRDPHILTMAFNTAKVYFSLVIMCSEGAVLPVVTQAPKSSVTPPSGGCKGFEQWRH